MAPFKDFYGRRYRFYIGLFDEFKVRPWGTDLLKDSLDKVKVIQVKLSAAQSRQKEYADQKVLDLEFIVGEQVLFKVSPMMGVMRFRKKGKLSPIFNCSFEISNRVGDVAYELDFPQRYHGHGSFIICCDSVLLDENLSYEEEPITIIDREVRKLRLKEIASVKVQWKNRPVDKAT
ncbi:uncharacterized protein LOC132644146 [Lycium barbarum]|uniref:uncharacterized protein LOC132644146 n=1 Tax=Lycium barbarum TaxID=112863 RepID=UPI00293F77C5|nr:uncharacterized protein LOC132644146 [Lycium barbarum]